MERGIWYMKSRIVVNVSKVRNTIIYIQKQYDQIFAFAKRTQKNGIDVLELAWQTDNSKKVINELVGSLNNKMKKITNYYKILINSLNSYAKEICNSGNNYWVNIEFKPIYWKFSCRSIENDDFVYDEDKTTSSMIELKKLVSDIIKIQYETVRKFKNNNECFGIENNNFCVINKFQRDMKIFIDEIDGELNSCIKKIDLSVNNQKYILDSINKKYNKSDFDGKDWSVVN